MPGPSFPQEVGLLGTALSRNGVQSGQLRTAHKPRPQPTERTSSLTFGVVEAFVVPSSGGCLPCRSVSLQELADRPILMEESWFGA